ncbi:MAG: hypothetical protein ABSF03_24865, partial [Streptosporangiaceae bacterium]
MTSTAVILSQGLQPGFPSSGESVTFTLTPPYVSFPLKPSSATPTGDPKKPTKLIFPANGTDGVAVGMTLSPVNNLIKPGTTVTSVTSTEVNLSKGFEGPLSAGQEVTFTFPLSSGIVQHTEQTSAEISIPGLPPNVMIPAAVATAVIPLNPVVSPVTTATTTEKCPLDTVVMTFGPGGTAQINVGMSVSSTITAPDPIAPGTTVQSVTATTVTLSTGVSADVPIGSDITFTINSDYLDININATRGAEIIPISNTFYNVLTSSDIPSDPTAISYSDTSLYVALPPQPGTNPISLAIPSDGSAPPFDQLLPAIQAALTNDTILDTTVASLSASPADCTRVAYDIIWSYQNALPAPPDPLEFLYTNPPNPGGGGGNSSGNSSNNNFEQDRQKFEGTLSSFYSARNANAERLAKFVAAASAAVFCEQASVNSTAALLEFPVDPSSAFAAAVESEVLLEGLGVTGPSGLDFGVPAAFFYALGANLDKTTTAAQRFQMATGDAIERLLQQFSAAANRSSPGQLPVINDSEAFADTALGLPDISSFQAARRLVALGVSAASSSPSVTVLAGSPLASLVKDWLSAVDPAVTAPQNPPLTYQNTDFNIWTQQLAITDPQGYVDLDLDAVTQGYIIPPFAASPSSSADSVSTQLVFGPGTGIGVGMPVAGPNIDPGTTVSGATTTATATTVTLSPPVPGSPPIQGSGVSTATVLVF